MDIPAPKDLSEKWTLHDASGRALCDAPCSRWVAPRSGYYLERAPSGEKDGVRIDLPNDIAAQPGSKVTAEYGPEKGAPSLSKLTFYGVGIPSGAVGLGLLIASPFVSDLRGFLIGAGIFYLAAAGASAWWFFYSDEKHFRVKSASDGKVHVGIGPGVVFGTF